MKLSNQIYDDFEPLPYNMNGWNGLYPVFKTLISQYNPSHIIEVGTWKGQSALHMADIVKELNLSCMITCVDTWLGSLEFIKEPGDAERDLMLKNGYPQVYYQFLSNVIHRNHQDIIKPFPATSLIAARWFKANNITAQLIYIDASHDTDDVIADMRAYYDIATGALFGDDYGWQSVKEAVDMFGKEVTFEDDKWIIRKPDTI